MHWLVKLLFWPWFAAPYHEWQGLLANWQAVAIVVCLFAILFAFQGPVGNPVGNRAKKIKSGWPSFLRHSRTTMAATIEVGLVGYVFNLLAISFNGGKMPLAPHTLEEYMRYETDGTDVYHVLATADTHFLLFADRIHVESSRLITYFFGWADYVSLGDLMMAASVIATWWIALVVVVWAFVWIVRRAIQRLTT